MQFMDAPKFINIDKMAWMYYSRLILLTYDFYNQIFQKFDIVNRNSIFNTTLFH